MATGQYLTEVALRLVELGHKVTVVTSRRAYDQPDRLFPKRETWRGISIYRVASTGLGKGAKWRRAADFGSFIASCSLRLAVLPKHDAIVALTSPPLISFLGAWCAKLRRSRFFYWVMDFNPDEAIAAGWLRPGSLVTRLLDWMSRFSLRQATSIIALDRFMRERILAKGIPSHKVIIVPPWSHDSEVRFDPEGRRRFRQTHGLEDKFVVMYSGNHSPCHPLDTLLAAARRLAGDPGILFCFIGGGSEWRKIRDMTVGQSEGPVAPQSRSRIVPLSPSPGVPESVSEKSSPSAPGKEREGERRPFSHTHSPSLADFRTGPKSPGPAVPPPALHPNLLCLPYQPLDRLADSLSAADLQVVVMGNAFVGLVHPCKIYNILSVAAPVLYIGPRPSHVTEILDATNHNLIYAAVGHGDVEGLVQQIQRVRRQASATHRQLPASVCSNFSKETVLPTLIAHLQTTSQ